MPCDLGLSHAGRDRSCPAVDQELPVSCGPSADQHYYAMGPIRLAVVHMN
jgi:hypothetical protein